MKQITVSKAEIEVIESDMKRAKKYLRFLEIEKEKGKASVASVREALSLAAVVAYNRPFTKCSRKGQSKRRPWIPSEVVDDLPTQFRVMHEELTNDRDQMWAHTDENAFDPKKPIFTLAKAFIPEMEELIKQVLARIHS